MTRGLLSAAPFVARAASALAQSVSGSTPFRVERSGLTGTDNTKVGAQTVMGALRPSHTARSHMPVVFR